MSLLTASLPFIPAGFRPLTSVDFEFRVSFCSSVITQVIRRPNERKLLQTGPSSFNSSAISESGSVSKESARNCVESVEEVEF